MYSMNHCTAVNMDLAKPQPKAGKMEADRLKTWISTF